MKGTEQKLKVQQDENTQHFLQLLIEHCHDIGGDELAELANDLEENKKNEELLYWIGLDLIKHLETMQETINALNTELSQQIKLED